MLEAWVEKLGQRKWGGAGNAKRWGIDFDSSAIDLQIESAVGMLTGLNSQSRTLRKRATKAAPGRNAAGIPTGVQCGSQETETETGTETGTIRRKEEDAASSAYRRPARSGEPYAFESGVIRLDASDLAKWRTAYPALSLEAELLSLSEWAGRPENRAKWFNAVQGALTKRQREHGLAVERVKAEGAARAHGPPARQPSAYVP